MGVVVAHVTEANVREARLGEAPGAEPLEAGQRDATSDTLTHLARLFKPAEQVGRRHAVVVSGGRGARRVRIGVRVHPDDAERRVLRLQRRDGARRDGVVAADRKDERRLRAARERALDGAMYEAQAAAHELGVDHVDERLLAESCLVGPLVAHHRARGVAAVLLASGTPLAHERGKIVWRRGREPFAVSVDRVVMLLLLRHR